MKFAFDDRAIDAAANVLRRTGRVHMPGALPESDAQVLLHASQLADWKLALNGDDSVYDLSASHVAALNPAQQEALLKAAHVKASGGFQFMFDSYRISDEAEVGRQTPGAFAALFSALNSAETLAMFRTLTGDARIVYADAQATRYRPGHFLTAHDDDVAGKDRLYAYVLNLTPQWRADWGGLLMFLAEDGHVAEAFTPSWNALNVLRVPQRHAVSVVASFALAFRYSVTGWLRGRIP